MNSSATDITFVIFNYDRLLEWKFAKAIRGIFVEKYRDGIQAGIRTMIKKVIHIHGSLSYRHESHYTVEELFGVAGYSGMQANSGRRDSDENLNELIRYQAKGIKIIGENDSTDAELSAQ